MPRNVDPKIVQEWIESVRKDLPDYIQHALAGRTAVANTSPTGS